MDARAAKLALARKKLKDHQDKKVVLKEGNIIQDETQSNKEPQFYSVPDTLTVINPEVVDDNQTINQVYQNENYKLEAVNVTGPQVNVTELLVSSKRDLELKVNELQLKLSETETEYAAAAASHNLSKQHINNLEKNLKNLNDKYVAATEDILSKDKLIENLYAEKKTLTDINNNMQDQLEFTKTVLTAKEIENDSLNSQLCKLQNQLDATQLHLQQITNGSADCVTPRDKKENSEINVALQQKMLNLEQQLKTLQKEKDQISSHYEHYVNDLNSQLKAVLTKNEELTKEVQDLTNRETGLVEQIGDMEIRLQNYYILKEAVDSKARTNIDINELQQSYKNTMEMLNELNIKYKELQKCYLESEAKVKELSQGRESQSCTHDEISITKLTADITSDKIAAQRATEQNRKLKTSVQDLEEAFIKLSQDKLELVEKLTAEKYLNRELTIKLAEFEEKAKDMHIKLMAKDEEMIRLQTRCRELEKHLTSDVNVIEPSEATENEHIHEAEGTCDHDHHHHHHHHHHNNVEQEENKYEVEEAVEGATKASSETSNDSNIPKEHAMLKLQERFLKIMAEVADLSDEKHRLEHIIMQLQNETDTICEYVALYQQQRSLLKKRDEERSAQVKIFQAECDRLRRQLEELGAILMRFAGDAQLSSYFQDEAKQANMAKVMDLLTNLKHNTLIDPKKISLDLNNFHPCSCCSGQLIEV
ncbi:golgin subfamily A member 2-like [Cydia strobilella]|uniref:golgin subfamily A member 2-like n=1 Tax=Cydia strobilella TaxID=1100964 RepID=UPI0030061895